MEALVREATLTHVSRGMSRGIALARILGLFRCHSHQRPPAAHFTSTRSSSTRNSCLTFYLEEMGNINLAGFIMTVFTTSAVVFWGRYLVPSFVVSWVSVSLGQVSALLDHGESLANRNQLNISFAVLNQRFIELRTDNHHAPGFFQQLGCIFTGLTCQLYVLWWDINAFQREVELAIDEQQLAALNANQNVAAGVLSDPTTNTAAPVNNVAEPSPPSLAAAV